MRAILIAISLLLASCAYISGPCRVQASVDSASAECESGGVLMVRSGMLLFPWPAKKD